MGLRAEIKSELDNDPEGRGYTTPGAYAALDDLGKAADDQAMADNMNDPNLTRNKTSLTGDEIFQATDQGDYTALTDEQKSQWLAFCARSTLDPFASANQNFVTDLIGAATVAALAILRVTPISRATELGLTRIRAGHVAEARLLT